MRKFLIIISILILIFILFQGCMKRELYIQRHTLPYRIKHFAEDQIRKPYCYGGKGPRCFDCSGLVYYVFKNFGIELPRSSKEIANKGKIVSTINSLKIGDIIVFKFGKSYHVGIYVGNFFFVHAPKKGELVRKEKINDYWEKRFLFGRRLF